MEKAIYFLMGYVLLTIIIGIVEVSRRPSQKTERRLKIISDLEGISKAELEIKILTEYTERYLDEHNLKIKEYMK